MISCNPPREESASSFPFNVRDCIDAGRADKILQRAVDEKHDRAHIDAADRRGDCRADGGGVLDLAGQQHFDVERCGHDHHLGVQPFLLKEAVLFGDEKRHGGDRHRRQADLDVLCLSAVQKWQAG